MQFRRKQAATAEPSLTLDPSPEGRVEPFDRAQDRRSAAKSKHERSNEFNSLLHFDSAPWALRSVRTGFYISRPAPPSGLYLQTAGNTATAKAPGERRNGLGVECPIHFDEQRLGLRPADRGSGKRMKFAFNVFLAERVFRRAL